MIPFYRKLFFRIFALFFVIALPFLTIFSLGYSLDVANKDLRNNLTIKLETFPRGASVYNEGREVLQTPGELLASDDKMVALDVKLANYMPERFILWSKSGGNLTVRLNNLWLLPNKSDYETKLDSYEMVSILSEKLLLLKKGDLYFVQNYNQSGLQGKPQQIQTKLKNLKNVSQWEISLENSFWQKEQNLLLYKVNNNWFLADISEFISSVTSVVYLSAGKFLLLDNVGNLWFFDPQQGQFSFLDKGFNGLNFTDSPDIVWLWKGANLYRIERNNLSVDNFSLQNTLYSSSSELDELATKTNLAGDFVVKSLFQGIAIQAKNLVFYISDFNSTQWQVLAREAITMGTSGNNLFWIDSSNRLFSYNLYLKIYDELGDVPIVGERNQIKIAYFYPWRRILIYSPSQVWTLWYDKDILNTGILNYKPSLWLNQTNCLPSVIDRWQFCLAENKFIGYKNNALW